MKYRSIIPPLHRILLSLIGMMVVFTTLGTALAAEGLSQGYQTVDTDLKPGMVVSLTADSTASNPMVERASIESATKIIGLAVNATDNSVVISPGKQQVYVQTTGNARGYVSDLNGQIKKGDLLTISPLRGIMMRADGTDSGVIGVALEDMAGKAAETFTIHTGSGDKEAKVVKLSVNLDHKQGGSEVVQQSTLARLGYSITGRPTSEVRMITSLIIFLLVLIAEGGIIYGAISSALTAIGRNPLSGHLIRHELLRVLVVAVIVLGFGLGAIYSLLWI